MFFSPLCWVPCAYSDFTYVLSAVHHCSVCCLKTYEITLSENNRGSFFFFLDSGICTVIQYRRTIYYYTPNRDRARHYSNTTSKVLKDEPPACRCLIRYQLTTGTELVLSPHVNPCGSIERTMSSFGFEVSPCRLLLDLRAKTFFHSKRSLDS